MVRRPPFATAHRFHPPCVGQYHLEEPHSAPNLPPQRDFLRDGSAPLFSMYSKMGEKEDDKIAKLWQKDADGILIFVSPRIGYTATPINRDLIDRFVLHGRCHLPYGVNPGSEAKSSTYIRILSRENLYPS